MNTTNVLKTNGGKEPGNRRLLHSSAMKQVMMMMTKKYISISHYLTTQPHWQENSYMYNLKLGKRCLTTGCFLIATDFAAKLKFSARFLSVDLIVI